MALDHLRRNAVAYLALVIACTTGTAYAADKLAPGSVTTKALAKNAVTSKKIKDRQIRARDIELGVLPQASEVFVENGELGTPVANPDGFYEPDDTQGYLAFPSGFNGGRVVVRFFSNSAFVDCVSGVGFAGLYLDGQPVPDTRRSMPGSSAGALPVELLAVIDMNPGAQKLQFGFDCAAGAVNVYGLYSPSFTATVLAR